MSERTIANKTKVHIGGHENSAFTPTRHIEKPSIYENKVSSRKDAYAYIKNLFSTNYITPYTEK